MGLASSSQWEGRAGRRTDVTSRSRSQYYTAGLETVTDSAIVVAQADGSHQRLLGDG